MYMTCIPRFCSFFRNSLLILLVFLASCLSEQQSQYPFCVIEACNCTTKKLSSREVVDVICNTIEATDIFSSSYWINSTTNQSFPYESVILEGNQIINLSKMIPASNLTYLNLADNDISGIGDSVFENLQNMRVLILSHNDLEIIHPDAFKVSTTYL